MGRYLRFASVALALLLVPGRAPAQGRVTLQSLRNLVGLSSPTPSPDGRTVVLAVSRPDYTSDRNVSELYAVDVATGATRQLTFGRRSASSPRWSPDGRTLGFLAPDSAGNGQVWLMPMAGGDVRPLTTSGTGVEQFAWRPDGKAIAYVATDPEPEREGEAHHLTTFTVGAQDLFLRHPVRPQHIWLMPTDGGGAERLTGGDWSLEFVLPPGSPPSPLAWSPDGSRIAFARVPVPESGKLDSVNVWILDVATRQVRSFSGPAVFQNNPSFSPDGRNLIYWYPRDGRADLNWLNEVYVAPADGGTARSVTRALDRNIYYAEWMPGGRDLLVAGNDAATVGVWLQPLDARPAVALDLGDLVVNGAFGYEIAVASTGAIVMIGTTASRPPELYVLDSATARPRRLTDFNGWATGISWGRMERIRWKSDSFDPDGVLTYPPDFSPSRTYPLVLLIHGGPTSASRVGFSLLSQLMAAEGWLVFSPNYRGSDNLGNAYQAAILRDWGKGPGRDVMAGVAELRKRSYVDRRRSAVTGWSYGGYMTTWLLGNYPDEWRAGMAGAPVTSWEDQYNYSDGSVSVRYAFGGSPWTGDRARIYREQSPITYATRIKAPTLVMSNMEDFRVPPTQALALYRALKDNGVETEFTAFGGRTHASGDPVNAMERARLWVEWVRRHIGEAVAPVP
jgi:dipeptidyl aminopeptidase/acylaminoacyl peptidase